MGIDTIITMSNKEREEFARICNYLLSSTYVMRDDKNGKISKDYLYIERNYDSMSEYLILSGWRLYKNVQYGVIYVSNLYGRNKLRLDKLPTVLLIVLRIIYEEKRVQVSSMNDVCTTVSEILQKLVNTYSLYAKKPPQKELKSAFRLLEDHNLIYKLDENYDNYECRVVILPSVLVAVSNEKTKLICDKLNAETEVISDEEDDEAFTN